MWRYELRVEWSEVVREWSGVWIMSGGIVKVVLLVAGPSKVNSCEIFTAHEQLLSVSCQASRGFLALTFIQPHGFHGPWCLGLVNDQTSSMDV
jgi:hypothetical protein